MLLIVTFVFIILFIFSDSAQANVNERKMYYNKEGLIKKAEYNTIDLSKVKDRQILIKCKNIGALDMESIECEQVNTPDVLKKQEILIVRVPDDIDYLSKLNELNSNKQIVYAEPNFIVEKSIIPNDKQFNNQWALQKIQLPSAWDISTGSSEVIIAVLDTGVDFSHPDLQGRLLNGYDYYNWDDDPTDDDGHGTFVAGIIAAATNNLIGISGVDWKCKILPIKVGGPKGFSIDAIVSGIYYAILSGADIINMSFGGSSSSTSEIEAIWEAYQNGIILVASSGNEGSGICYPAEYMPVISVGATDENDNVADFSNYGNRLNVVSPGVNILSTVLGGGYNKADGTSCSAPILSGIASLILAHNPNLSPDEVQWLIESSAFMPPSVEGEWDPYYGYGGVDAFSALTKSLPDLTADAGNKRSDAKKIDMDKTYPEYVDLPMDDDWFQFGVDQNDEIIIEIEVPDNIDIVAWIDKYENGQIVWEERLDSGYMGEGESIKFEASPGDYYIYIYEYNNHWSNSPYSIRVSGTAGNTPPSAGTIQVTPEQKIQVVFNQSVKLTSDLADYFHILDSNQNEIPIDVHFIGDASVGETQAYSVFWLEPNQNLMVGNTYQMLIDSGLLSDSGSELKDPYKIDLIVVEQCTGPNEPIEDVGYSRLSPASIGTTLLAEWENYKGEHKAYITLVQVIRGEKAWQLLQEANMFNDPPPVGYEYVLAKIRFKYLAGPSADTHIYINGNIDFTAVSGDGVDYDYASVVDPEPDLDCSLYPGGTHEGWASFLVKITDNRPLLTFGRDYDGSGGIWFKLYSDS